MSVASSSVATPTRTKALMVRLAPYLVEAICELTRAIKDKTHAQTEISGLLFGKSQDGTVTVEALKTFKDSSGPRSDLARRERMEKAFTAAMSLANEDPEFSAYKLLGWFSLRGSGGLINSDVEFHNRHFKNVDEVALIVWREGETQITNEIYAAVESGKITTEDYRWSSVRLSTELRHVSQPLDLVMRVRMNDDLYMRTYGVADGKERKEEWRKIADSAKRTLLSFLPGRSNPDTVYGDDLPLPAPTGTASRSFESRTLFRGTENEPSSAVLPQLKATVAAEASAAAAASPAAAPGIVTRVKEQPPSIPTSAAPGATTRQIEPPSFDFNRAPRPRPAVAEVSGLPMVIPKNRPAPPKGTPWLSMAAVFILFSALTFGFMALRASSASDGKLNQIMRVLFPGSDLDLRAESHGDSLWVSWNRRNPVVSSATGAVLTVNDGPRHFERKLDAGQVADGEVKYTPVSGDVTFQLRVIGADQAVALGSLRVVDATGPMSASNKSPLDISDNSQAPASTDGSNKRQPTTTLQPVNSRERNSDGSNNRDQASNPATLVPPPTTNLDPPPGDAPKPAPAAANAAGQSTSQSTAPSAPSPQPAPVQQQQQQPPATPAAAVNNPPAATAVPGAAKPTTAAPHLTPTYSNSGQQTSNTAISGWDPNLPENKPPAPPQSAATAPTDSRAADFIGPKVLLQVMPNPRNLTPGSITQVTRVEVEVRVDTTGHVKSAHLVTQDLKGQVGSAAVAAAKQWTFQPATLRGNRVESDHTIVFEFRPEGQ